MRKQALRGGISSMFCAAIFLMSSLSVMIGVINTINEQIITKTSNYCNVLCYISDLFQFIQLRMFD